MFLTIFLVATFGGMFLGFLIGVGLADGYQSKKTCRECRRRIVEYGFYSDSKEYIAVEKDKEKKEGST